MLRLEYIQSLSTWVKINEKLVWVLVRVRIHESLQYELGIGGSKPSVQILPSLNWEDDIVV